MGGANQLAALEAVLGRQDAHLAEAEVLVVVLVCGDVVFVVGAGEAEDVAPGEADGGLACGGLALVVNVGVYADADVLVHVWAAVAGTCSAGGFGF